ncbi:hypothetical protein, partial [Mycoplasmopsis bovis]|uniref:hypothetical protein n=1 Tax=Mycoplasmopsis bovis TaxID=28903 RepID=UPI003D2A8874
KTGTPPRIYSDSINFDEVEQEVLSDVNISFSSRSNLKMPKQIILILTLTQLKLLLMITSWMILVL